jgi:protein tyrosine phosphatase (PTP) superfamily phosphohydrolase (DUF442 family)
VKTGGLLRFVVVSLIAFFFASLAGCSTHRGNAIPGIQNFGKVSPEIWRGAKPTDEGLQTLSQMGVKTIIDLQMDDESPHIPPGINYIPLRCSLWQCDKLDCEAVVKAIDDSPKPLFIHCLQGRDRAGLAIAAWRLKHGTPLNDVLAELDSFGINPVWAGPIKSRIRQLYKTQNLPNYAQDAPATVQP